MVKGYIDSDFTSDADKRKSTTSYVFTLIGATVNWVSKLQMICGSIHKKSKIYA